MVKNIRASAGSRTRIDCLEGNHANRYTTDAFSVNEFLHSNEYSMITTTHNCESKSFNCTLGSIAFPSGLVVRIPRSHRGGRGSIPRLGIYNFTQNFSKKIQIKNIH